MAAETPTDRGISGLAVAVAEAKVGEAPGVVALQEAAPAAAGPEMVAPEVAGSGSRSSLGSSPGGAGSFHAVVRFLFLFSRWDMSLLGEGGGGRSARNAESSIF